MDKRIQSKTSFESLCFRQKAIELQYAGHRLPPFVQNIMDHLSEAIRLESKKHNSKKMIPFGLDLLETYYTNNDSHRATLMLSTLKDTHNQYDYTIYRVDLARRYARLLFQKYPPILQKPCKVASQTPLSEDYLPGFGPNTGRNPRED